MDRKLYELTIELSKPLVLTRDLGKCRAWILVIILIIVNGGSGLIVLLNRLYSLDPLRAIDHFSLKSDSTTEYFVGMAV